MIATLLFTVVAQQQQYPPTNYFQEIIGEPTGSNGYEEYVRAVDSSSVWYLNDLVRTPDATDQIGTRLDRQRVVARQVVRAQAFIEQGNKKNVWRPGVMDFSTGLPELVHFRNLGRAMVHKAEVHFADGQVNQGFSTLLTVMEFGDKVSGSGPMIHNLVGRAINRPALELLSKNAALMSIPAGDETRDRVRTMLSAPSPWANSLRIELKGIIDSLPKALDDPTMYLGIGSQIAQNENLANLSTERKRQITNEILFYYLRLFEARLEMFERPEREWPALAKQIDALAVPEDPVAKTLFDLIQPAFGRIDIYEIARRTQFRLLIVYSEVAKFRWNHGFYPGLLTQLEDQSNIIDPLTGEPFEYQRTETSFTVYSRGTAETGKIDLFYTPPRPGTIKPE